MAIEEAALIEPADFTAEVRNENGATVVSLAGELTISPPPEHFGRFWCFPRCSTHRLCGWI